MDGDSTYGILDHTFLHMGDPMAVICFKPAGVTPPMTDSLIQPHSGAQFGACFASVVPPNNDWLISPHVQLGNGGEFTFWAKSYTDQYGLEKFRVAVSVTDNNPASFTVISGPSPVNAPVSWTKMIYNLSAYNGQAVYVAIQCVSDNAFIFMVDDLTVNPGATGGLSANFIADRNTIAAGDSVLFTDLSTGSPVSWNWSFPGGTPDTSALQHPGYVVYNAPGSYNVTLVVSDGISTDTLTMPGYITVTQSLPSQMSLDFESLGDFVLNFNPWYTADLNGGATWAIMGVQFPNEGAQMAWICFNPLATTPPTSNMAPHSGVRMGACISSMPPHNPNSKWLISPRMYLGGNPKIDLWVKTYDSTYGGNERYNIGVSTTTNSPGNFTIVNGNTPESAPVAWTLRSYNLAAFANQAAYVAIQCVSDNLFIFMIDDISITSIVGVPESVESFARVYPNPASGNMFVVADPSSGGAAQISLLNIMGTRVREYHPVLSGSQPAILPVDGLPSGIYFLKIRLGEKSLVRKITILE
jgi:PKD repeat protein